MNGRSYPISLTQAIAYESASHELGRLLDDAAALIRDIYGEQSVIGRLADEARWTAFLLHDRIATHAIRHRGVPAEKLAIRALTPDDLICRSPGCFGAEHLSRGRLELERRLAAALSTTQAAIVGMSGG